MITLLKMSLSASVLIAAALALRFMAADKLPRRLFTAFWTVAVLRMLIPFYVSFPYCVKSAETVNGGADIYSDAEYYGVYTAGKAAESGEKQFDPKPAAEIVYTVGVCAAAAFFLLPHMRFGSSMKCSLPLKNAFISEHVNSFGIRRTVRIAVSDRVSTPCTFGVLRPTILFPKTFDLENKTQLEYVLVHELVHIKRFDAAVKYAAAAAVCLHWFNPLAWVMYCFYSRDIELVCDEEVLKLTGGTRSQYAMTLISLEEERSAVPTVIGFGAGAVRERISAIMKFKDRSVLCIVIAAALAAGSLAVFVSADGGEKIISSAKSSENEVYSADVKNDDPSSTPESKTEEKHYMFFRMDDKGVYSEFGDGGIFRFPIAKPDLVSEPFGDGHKGVDFSWDGCAGENVLASSDGTVSEVNASGYGNGYGRYIVIDHGNGISSFYAHCEKVYVSVGEHVATGQVIGTIGSTGQAVSPHLHFEIRKNGVCIDPMDYLLIDTSAAETVIYSDYAESENYAEEKAGDEISSYVTVTDVENTAVEDGEWSEGFLSEYFPLGLSADRENKCCIFDGKPVAGFVDKDGELSIKVMTDGAAMENGGIFLKAVRENGLPKKLEIVDKAEFANLSGITVK